jgi:hypothetical protein
MLERYRLVFRGELLDGEQKSSVKRRLGAALKVDGERLDAMFTGKAVVIRKEADTDTAARFQIAFKRAGARLRVLPVAIDAAAPITEVPTGVSAAPARTPVESAGADDPSGLRLAPAGALLIEPSRTSSPPAVDTSHLALASPGALLGEPVVVAAAAPDVSHLTIAALGTVLGEPDTTPSASVSTPSWKIAPPGALLARRAPEVEPPVDVDALGFEVAPPGALLDAAEHPAPPPPPDTSHLELQ